jgi:hypothetical protein
MEERCCLWYMSTWRRYFVYRRDDFLRLKASVVSENLISYWGVAQSSITALLSPNLTFFIFIFSLPCILRAELMLIIHIKSLSLSTLDFLLRTRSEACRWLLDPSVTVKRPSLVD